MSETSSRATRQFFIEPLSPLVLRSGRPFGASGQTGATAGPDMPLPGTLAGTLRAAWCEARSHEPTDQDTTIDRLHLQGPLQMTLQESDLGPRSAQYWLPAPANARREESGRAVALQPGAPSHANDGCDLPMQLLPTLPPAWVNGVLSDPPPLWELSAVVDWLRGQHQAAPGRATSRSLAPPARAEQVHIRVDPGRQVLDHAFFINSACDYTLPAALAHLGRRGLWQRAEVPALTHRQHLALPPEQQFSPKDLLSGFDSVAGQAWRLGADGAAAQVHAVDDLMGPEALLEPLAEGLQALQPSQWLCLLLATPACFGRNGFYPWLRRDDARPAGAAPRTRAAPQIVPEGRLPGWPEGWRFRLRSAIVGAAVPQGSFKARSLRAAPLLPGQETRSGLGRLQWLAPAGSMYWFEVVTRPAEPLQPALLQLRSCCNSEFARDGQGLAIYAAAPGLPTTPQ